MTVNKRRKSSRLQGSNTHGWGKNQHRGAGTRGGRGNAGYGKKAHGKKTEKWGEDYLGKHGFSSKNPTKITSITLQAIEEQLPNWVANKKASEQEINLGELGYNKLLGNGKFTKKIKITVAKASAKTAEKVKAAGGELVVA